MYNKPTQNRNDDNRGALFNRNKKTANAPDMGGDLTLDRAMVDYLVKCLEDGIEPKIELSCWRKAARNGGTYLTIAASVPFALRGGGAVRNDPRGIPDRNVYQGHQAPGPNYSQQPTAQGQYRSAPNRYAEQTRSQGYVDNGPGTARYNEAQRQANKDDLPWD